MSDTLTILRKIAEDLRDDLAEHDMVCADLAGIDPLLGKARLVARAKCVHRNPKMRLDDITMYVEMDTEVEKLRDLHDAADWRRRAVKERLHTSRQLLSAFQSQGRIEADLTRHG